MEIPPIVIPPVCDNTTITTSILDINTGEQIQKGVKISLAFTPFDELTKTVLVENASSLALFPITDNGKYFLTAHATDYKSASREVIFNCTKETCGNCSKSLDISLKEDFCEETRLNVKVTDQETPVREAHVFLYRKGNQSITFIGFRKTDKRGKTGFPVDGRAEYQVVIKKNGYQNRTVDMRLYCRKGQSCSDCSITLSADIEEIFCNKTVEIAARVLDANLSPIENATVTFIAKSTMNGPQELMVELPVKTNASGIAQQNIHQFGVYSVNVSAEGYLSETRSVNVVNGTACEDQLIPVKFTLENQKKPFCANSSLHVVVHDKHTGVKLTNAKVVIKLKNELIAESLTGTNGDISIDIAANGNYSISVTKEGYLKNIDTAIFQCSLNDCSKCNVRLNLEMDQPRCKDIKFPVTVTDFHDNEKPVVNANVELYRVQSLSGTSNTFIGRRKTNENGTAVFLLQVNGNYTVKISAAGYISDDKSIQHQCNQFHCKDCNPVLNPQIKKEFCENKTMQMVVRNAIDNQIVADAKILVWMDVNSARDGRSTFFTNSLGRVHFPILANGVLNVKISKDGFITLIRKFVINVQMGECNAYAPMELSPLSPSPLCDRGVRVSLAWGENPSDLDLYSYRVNCNNTNDECLTYYCDHKDPCNGTTHDVDNKNGGLNGSETITYCQKEDYVNMVFVDDLSGRGSSILQSQAKIIIQGQNQSEEIALDSKKTIMKTGKRYWLVGCLTQKHDRFDFLEVNEFRDEQPNIETPHFCYNLIKLKQEKDFRNTLSNARLVVNVKKENTIFYDSSVEMKTPKGVSRYREVGETGNVTFPVFENGWYEIIVQAPGYSPAVEKILIHCNHSEVLCSSDVNLALSLLRKEGSVKINLNWEANLNLDLHTVQLGKDSIGTHCETFYGQRDACRDTTFGSDIRTGGMPAKDEGEAITIDNIANNPSETYMIFIQDNSVIPQLSLSNPRISIMDGRKEEVLTMPVSNLTGAIFWFAGCLSVMGNTFRFEQVNHFSRTSPLEKDLRYCDRLFKKARAISRPAFCMGKYLDIKIVDSQNNRGIRDAEVQVVRTHGNDITNLNVSLHRSQNRQYKLPLESNGLYKVEVKRSEFHTAWSRVRVNCDILRCAECKPTLTIPMVTNKKDRRPQVVLVWEKERNSLELYAIQNSALTGSDDCVSKKQKCSGVQSGPEKSTGNHFQNLFIGSTKGKSINYYTLVVDLKTDGRGNEIVDDTIKKSNVHIVITDAYGESVREKMKTQTYKKDRYWLVGCIGGEYTLTASFTPINQFVDSPPEKGEDYCKHFISKGLKNCFTGLRGPSFSVADNKGLVVSSKTSSAKECADKCTLEAECGALEWFGRGDRQFKTCLLYKSGKLSGSLEDGRVRYASICPKQRKPCLMMNTDRLGSDFKIHKSIPTAKQCRNLCKRNSKCKSWTWASPSYNKNPTLRGWCFLKNAIPSTTKVHGLISGLAKCETDADNEKPCIMTNTKLSGSDIHVFGAKNKDICRTRCKQLSTCKSWTWVSNAIADVKKREKCHLKNHISSPIEATGQVSGYKVCATEEESPEKNETKCPGEKYTRTLFTSGKRIKMYRNRKAEVCRSGCEQNKECVHWFQARTHCYLYNKKQKTKKRKHKKYRYYTSGKCS